MFGSIYTRAKKEMQIYHVYMWIYIFSNDVPNIFAYFSRKLIKENNEFNSGHENA